MREVERTVEQAGLEPLMSVACAERHSWAAQWKSTLAQEDLGALLDAILTAVAERKQR